LERPYTVKELIDGCKPGEWAIPGFNVFNMEFAQAVVDAAELEQSPVIMMIGDPVVPYVGLDMFFTIGKFLVSRADVPIAMVLDHGKTEEHLRGCIESGVSVMYDGSELSLEENIKKTSNWASAAHAAGLSIEGEIGSFGAEFDEETGKSGKADPAECEQFAGETGVDMLAVAIGNYHGRYESPPQIDLDLLSEIQRRVQGVPLVLHGASGIDRETIRECVKRGIKKVNIGYDLKMAFADTLRQELTKEPMPFQPPHYLRPARNAVIDVVRERIRDVGTSGLAKTFSLT
jgi:fructose-bisphosphate aldolase, class II